MNTSFSFIASLLVLMHLSGDSLRAQEGRNEPKLGKWGVAVNPDGDCRFQLTKSSLIISVPGSERPHDLAAEIDCINAPRVLKSANGDFTLQVRIEGRFAPGDQSTKPGRTGYNGAALVAMVDPQNVATLARAVLQRSGEAPTPYLNFEIRVNGALLRMGSTGDRTIPLDGPLYLRLERRGQKLIGAASVNGQTWDVLPAKDVPASWPGNLSVGVAAISTSREEFSPHFSQLQLLQ